MSEGILSLHPLLSERVRLAIMAALAASNKPVEFTRLEQTLEVSKGNLSSHLRKLEESNLIKMQKRFVGRKPQTSFECTAQGRKEFDRYLATMEQTLKLLKASK